MTVDNEELSKEINKLSKRFEEFNKDKKDATAVFVQDRITCKCGCHLYRVAYNYNQYIITPAYLLMLANNNRIKNSEYEIKTSKTGRQYVEVKYMKHIKSKWTFAQFDGRERIYCTAFSGDLIDPPVYRHYRQFTENSYGKLH